MNAGTLLVNGTLAIGYQPKDFFSTSFPHSFLAGHESSFVNPIMPNHMVSLAIIMPYIYERDRITRADDGIGV